MREEMEGEQEASAVRRRDAECESGAREAHGGVENAGRAGPGRFRSAGPAEGGSCPNANGVPAFTIARPPRLGTRGRSRPHRPP